MKSGRYLCIIETSHLKLKKIRSVYEIMIKEMYYSFRFFTHCIILLC